MSREREGATGDVTCLAAMALFLAGIAVLAVRLKGVQVDGAAEYSYEKVRQSVRRVQTVGERGRILDRNGGVLAGNRTSASIVCAVSGFQRRTRSATVDAIEKALAAAEKAVGRKSALSRADIERHVRQSPAMPLFAWRDVGDDELARFSERSWEFPGLSVEATFERVYPNGALAAHLLGYVGRDRGESVAGDSKFSFCIPEMRGRRGLEQYYDSFLRGMPGERNLLVDARGFAVEEWTVTEPRKGLDLSTTIDLILQREAERQLSGVRGACVAIDPRNGDVLVMASSPTFNPNEFVPFLGHALYSRYSEDPAKPLLNRAAGGTYAPGSTFKPVTALAGLSIGVPAGTRFDCAGIYEIGAMRIRCSRRWGHGPLDMAEALRESCNSYFCNLAADIGTNALVRAARAFGLGSKTGIDFGLDAAGVVPDAEWKMSRYGEKWYPGDLSQMSIGQGMLLVTPLQMARVAGALGTGRLVAPRIMAGAPEESTALPFAKEHLDVVRRGMRMVVDGGTGKLGGEGVAVAVAGKTGTAEVGSGATRRKNTWFMAYAPAERPELAVALVVEDGESGGTTAAPRVAEILKRRFGGG